GVILVVWGPASPGATISRAGPGALAIDRAPDERHQPEQRPQRHPAEPGEDEDGHAERDEEERHAEQGAAEQARADRGARRGWRSGVSRGRRSHPMTRGPG